MTMESKNKQLIKQFCTERNSSETTFKNYEATLNKYCRFQGLNLYELIEEAEREEDEGIRLKKSSLKRRLTEYRCHLIETASKKTVKTNMSRIQTFYRHFEIELPELSYVSEKSMNDYEPIYYTDLPDKEIIRKAVNVASPIMKSILLFELSSGCGRREVLNLTIGDYITACGYSTENIEEALQHIRENENELVPTFKIKRQKTDKYYVTFCSYEAVEAINLYIMSRTDKLTTESKLFKISENYYSVKFAELNEYLKLGKKGAYNRMRGHMIRKVHASSLMQGENGLTLDEIDSLQGRTRQGSRASYFFDNTTELKKKYIEAMPNVLLNTEVKRLDVRSREFRSLENDVEYLKKLAAKISFED